MESGRVLLMHISNISGHRCASIAIEKALKEKDRDIRTLAIDAFNYTNPFLERFVTQIYMFVIKILPCLWDYLYDNQCILRGVKNIRALIHRLNERKLSRLFNDFQPDLVVCTQAFPCGMVADYKRRHNLNIPLIGVLTDYAPHGYWLNELVDIYIVPSLKIKQRFIQRGLSEQQLKILGIPIESKFAKKGCPQEIFQRLGLNSALPVILIMGGSQGLGPIKKIVEALDRLDIPAQLIVVCGINKKLYNWMKRHRHSFKKTVIVIDYTEEINNLMEISSFIVSKAGGLTCAEALSKSLPIVIISPLPGQESQNTRFLQEIGVGLKVDSLIELKSLAEELLSDARKLEKLRQRAGSFARADSASRIAELILNTIRKTKLNQNVISSI